MSIGGEKTCRAVDMQALAPTYSDVVAFVFLDYGRWSAPIIKVTKWRLKIINFGRSEIFETNSFRIWIGDTLHDLMMLCRRIGHFGFWHNWGRFLRYPESEVSHLEHRL